MRLLKRAFALVAMLSAMAPNAWADYPERPITIIVPFSAGGSSDVTMRFLADALQRETGVPVVVQNRPGGGATVGLTLLTQAKPDGYTLGLISNSPVLVAPHFQNLPYSVAKDFTFIGQYMVTPAPLAVLATSPFQTLDELLEYGRKNPGKLRWGTGAPKGMSHISTTMAFHERGVETTFVPFAGGTETIAALLGGDIDFSVLPELMPLFKQKQVRLLAESGPNRIPSAPDVPTYKDLGFPMAISIFYGIGGPAGLDDDVVEFWERFLKKQENDPKFHELLDRYASSASVLSAREFTKAVLDGNRLMGEGLKNMNMQ